MYQCDNCDFSSTSKLLFLQHQNCHESIKGSSTESTILPAATETNTTSSHVISPSLSKLLNTIKSTIDNASSNNNCNNKEEDQQSTIIANAKSPTTLSTAKTNSNIASTLNTVATEVEKIQVIYLCSLCFNQFLTIDKIKQHMIQEHDYEPIPIEDNEYVDNVNIDKDDNNRSINNINQTTDTQSVNRPISLKQLKLKLNKRFAIRCSYNGCKYSFETNDKKMCHEKCHLSKEQIRDFKCNECQMEFKAWRQCTQHLWKLHEIDVDLLQCLYCSYKSTLCVQLFRHLQVHCNTRGFACSHCSKIFKQYSQLRLHSLSHLSKKKTSSQQSPIRWYLQKTCEICNSVFANSKTRSKHIKQVHNKIKPFICSVCGHKSARKSSLQVHVRQHTGEKPLLCNYCNFRAADPSVIKKHERRHTKIPQYKCMDCGQPSRQSIAYKNHVRTQHPERYKTFLCNHNQCNFVSINKVILERHCQKHKLGLLEDSNDGNSNLFKDPKPSSNLPEQPQNGNVEISSDCFLPLESTDSLAHDPPLDTGGVTIPASHSEETQFPNF